MPLHPHVFALLRALPFSRGKGRIGSVLARKLVDANDAEAAILSFSMRDGSLMRTDIRSWTSQFAYWTGRYDDAIRRLVPFIAPGTTVLDIGAHVGFYTVPLARAARKSGGRVFAFEPMPGNFEFLGANIAANGLENVAWAFPIALCERECTLAMRNSEPESRTGNAVVVNSQNRLVPTHTARGRRLDDFAREHPIGSCSLIKVDIEGAELMLLRGAVSFLSQHRPFVYGEFNARWMQRLGASFLDVWELMAPLDFEFFQFSGRKWVEIPAPTVGLQNVLLVPREKRDQL